MRSVCVAFVLLLSAPAFADESVVLGKFTRQYDLHVKPDCPQATNGGLVAICMDSWFGFEIATTRTLAGVPITGRVKVARLQHALFASQFFRTLRSTPALFVLQRIEDAETREKLRSDYYMVELSAPESMYCLTKRPESYGLGDKAPVVYASSESDDPSYCFELKE